MTVSISLLVSLPFAIWVAIDAHRLGVQRRCLGGGFVDMSVVGWFFSVWLLLIIGLPLYLATRGRYVRRQQMLRGQTGMAASLPPWATPPGSYPPGQFYGVPGQAFGPPGGGYGPPGGGYGPPGGGYGPPGGGYDAPPNPPPGWYIDPSSPRSYRWWDGYQWGQQAPPPPAH